MRILVIEDDNQTAEFVIQGFQQAGFRTDRAANGLDGLFKVKTEPYDVVLVDIMLPKLDGYQVIEEIRSAGFTMPIMVLSAKNSVENKIRGLEKGGDDYLAKPFSLAELLVRVQTLLRRANASSEPTLLQVADLSLNIVTRKVTRDGQKIDLQPLEYILLEYLMRNTGRVVSKTTIMEHVWEYHFDTQSNVVEARVCRLREKIDKSFERKLIHTVRGFGYVLE